MRRKFTVYGLRFSKTTFWNRLNTGFLEPAVATALTACGIETTIIGRMHNNISFGCNGAYRLRYWNSISRLIYLYIAFNVATAFTACGIETLYILRQTQKLKKLQRRLPLAVLKLCYGSHRIFPYRHVATALTACGIETFKRLAMAIKDCQLQRRLPLAVLKLSVLYSKLTVLMSCNGAYRLRYWNYTAVKFDHVASVATALTACGIETSYITAISIYCT